jgi:hypothetical protein
MERASFSFMQKIRRWVVEEIISSQWHCAFVRDRRLSRIHNNYGSLDRPQIKWTTNIVFKLLRERRR